MSVTPARGFYIRRKIITKKYLKKALWPRFMDGVQLSQGYRTTSWRQFTFYHSVPRISWCSFNWPQKDKRLSQSWSHLVVLNLGPLDWESSALTNRRWITTYFVLCMLLMNKNTKKRICFQIKIDSYDYTYFLVL